MRILHFVHGYLPRHRGGTESYVAAIVRGLRTEGLEVAVATGTEEAATEACFERTREQGHDLYRIRRAGLHLDSWQSVFDPEAEEVAVAAARDYAPDLIHVHHWRRLGSGLVRRLRAEGFPVVLTLHDLSTTCARSFRVRDESYCERPPIPASCRDCVDRFWYQGDEEIDARIDLWREEMVAELGAASRILAPSRALALEVVERLGVEAGDLARRIDIAPLGTLAEEAPGRPRGEVIRLAYWGALQPMKGPHLLLQALGRLSSRNWELDLWGDPEQIDPLYRERLLDLMRGLPVRRRGAFRADEIPGHYDLAIFPSVALESHSFTVDEAFARGIPVLVPDRGAPAGRLSGGGRTFRAEDVRDLSKELDDLIDDHDALDRLREKVSQPLSMAVHVAALRRVYSAALEQPGPMAGIDDGARARFGQLLLRARDEELWRIRGRVDQELDRAEGLQTEVDARDREIRRRDEILAESNKNLARISGLLAEREQDLARVSAEHGRIERELRADLAGRDLDAQKRESVVNEFSRSTEQLSARSAALEQERDDLAERVRSLDASLQRDAEAALVKRQDLEAEVEIERRRRQAAELGLETGAGERDKLLLHAKALESRGEEDRRTAAEKEAEASRRREESEKALRIEHDEVLQALRIERDEALQALRIERDEAVTVLEARLEALATEILDLETRQKEVERGRDRLRRMADNLRAEFDQERENLALTSEALDRALAELEGSRDQHKRLVSRLLERLAPIAAECGVTKPETHPAEELIEVAVANHQRLHELIGERDQLLQDLVLRVDDYERRLDPAPSASDAGNEQSVASGIRRRISGLKRRMDRRRLSDRLRILIVVHDFLPEHNAGTEIYTFNLARELSERHDVHLLFCEARHDQPRYTIRRGSYEGLPFTEVVHNYQWESFEETYHDPRMEEIFAGVLNDFQPDVLHIQHLHYFSLRFIDLAKDRNLPVVYTLHEFMLLCARGGQLLREDMEICELPIPEKCADCIRHQKLAGDYGQSKERRARELVADLLPTSLQRAFSGFAGPRQPAVLDEENRAIYARAAAERLEFIKRSLVGVDLFISPSAFLRDRFIAAGMVRPDQIIHSDNGFDSSPFQGVAREPSPTLRFGFVGTIAEYKGIHVMVEAMNGIRDAGVELQIWGDVETFADYKARLLPLIDNPAIRLMGRFENEKIAEVLAGIDVLIVPSLWFENSPLTIHEAWLAGIPVLASDRGGMAELVDDGVNGFHFRLGDPADLRAKMRRFIAEPRLAETMGAKPGPVKAIADNAREIEAIYHGLVRSGSR